MVNQVSNRLLHSYLCYILPYGQRHTNSKESDSSKVTKTVLPTNLLAEQHLQSAESRTVCDDVNFRRDMQHKEVVRNDGWSRSFTDQCPQRRNIMIASEVEEDQNKEEVPELFPLHPDGNLGSKTRPHPCEGNFTDSPRSNVLNISSKAKEVGNKRTLLDLFP